MKKIFEIVTPLKKEVQSDNEKTLLPVGKKQVERGEICEGNESKEDILNSLKILKKSLEIIKEIRIQYGDTYAKKESRHCSSTKNEELVLLDEGVNLFCSSVESIIKKIEQHTDKFSGRYFVQDTINELNDTHRKTGSGFNQAKLMELTRDILSDIHDNKIASAETYFDFIHLVCERIDSTMYVIHQYGEPEAYIGKWDFNMAANNLKNVKYLIEMARKDHFEPKNINIKRSAAKSGIKSTLL